MNMNWIPVAGCPLSQVAEDTACIRIESRPWLFVLSQVAEDAAPGSKAQEELASLQRQVCNQPTNQPFHVPNHGIVHLDAQ
jgi:hypothetical protein